MAISEHDRSGLHEKLSEVLGPDFAGVMMEMVPHDPEQLATKADVKDLRSEMSAGFQAVDARFSAIDAEFSAIDAKFSAIDVRFENIDVRFENIDVRFDAIDARFDGIEARFEGFDARFDGQNAKIDAHRTELTGLIELRTAELSRDIAAATKQHTVALIGFSVATWGALLGGAILA